MPGQLEEVERALAREREKLRALQDIGAALGSTLDLDELLGLILDHVSGLMRAERSTLYLLDEERGELWSKVAQGQDGREIRLKLGDGLAGWVAQTGEVLNIDDVYQDPRFDAEWDRRTGYRTRTTLCVPMKNPHGRTIGVVQVLNKHEGVFSSNDASLLQSLAAQAAVSIENSKLFLSVVRKNMELLETKEQLERRVRELDVLFEIAQVSANAEELEELLDGVLARTMRATEAEAVSILLTDGEEGDLRFLSAVGGVPSEVRKSRVRANQGICGWVAEHGESKLLNNAEEDPAYSKEIAEALEYDPRSIVCVPLSVDDEQGALELFNKEGGTEDFTADDVKLATIIAGHISTAIRLMRSRAERGRQERLSTIGQFLSGVLHDLKTPMTVVSGYVQLQVDEEDLAVRHRYAELVQRQVELINTMTRETLAFARGDRKLWVRKVYLHKFFADVADQVRRELGEKNVEVDLDLRFRGVAYLDAPKIQRAVHNLARNAVEAIGNEGGTFSMAVDQRDDGALVLSFTDDGPGISEQIRARLFSPFATHGKAKGTGLGLAIVRSVVEDHQGTISVESEPGHTVFTIVIPQDPNHRTLPPPPLDLPDTKAPGQ